MDRYRRAWTVLFGGLGATAVLGEGFALGLLEGPLWLAAAWTAIAGMFGGLVAVVLLIRPDLLQPVLPRS